MLHSVSTYYWCSVGNGVFCSGELFCFFFLKFLEDISHFCRVTWYLDTLIHLFWTCFDTCPGFQGQVGSPTRMLCYLSAVVSSYSSLVWHLLTSWWPALQSKLFIHILAHVFLFWWIVGSNVNIVKTTQSWAKNFVQLNILIVATTMWGISWERSARWFYWTKMFSVTEMVNIALIQKIICSIQLTTFKESRTGYNMF